jgi:hypothetical protein
MTHFPLNRQLKRLVARDKLGPEGRSKDLALVLRKGSDKTKTKTRAEKTEGKDREKRTKEVAAAYRVLTVGGTAPSVRTKTRSRDASPAASSTKLPPSVGEEKKKKIKRLLEMVSLGLSYWLAVGLNFSLTLPCHV